ncbi:MAG TPA: tetratricopeptide repeat protein [Polyangiales bacterium]
MAKPKITPPKKVDIAEAASQVEMPRIKWKIVGTVLAAFAVLWITAAMMYSVISYWGFVVVGLLTVAALGLGLYVWRLTSKQKDILEIMRAAQGEGGRKEAIERLAAGADKDAMKALARAQLLAQEDPQKALEALEAIDIEKAPALVRDEVRSQRAMMYLFMNRPKEARPLVDEIKLERQPDPKAKAKYAATIAEGLARTGSAEEAKKLMTEYKADDPQWAAEVGPLLWRAQVYTFMATKNRGLAKKALDQLIAIDPNMVAPFIQKNMNPELQKLAMQALADAGLAPRAQMKMRMKM